jgi:hypothetical protein
MALLVDWLVYGDYRGNGDRWLDFWAGLRVRGSTA